MNYFILGSSFFFLSIESHSSLSRRSDFRRWRSWWSFLNRIWSFSSWGLRNRLLLLKQYLFNWSITRLLQKCTLPSCLETTPTSRKSSTYPLCFVRWLNLLRFLRCICKWIQKSIKRWRVLQFFRKCRSNDLCNWLLFISIWFRGTKIY